MMSDTADKAREYLQGMLHMQPSIEANEMLSRRRQFLASRELAEGEILAVEVAEESSRPTMLQSLADIRKQFWTLPAHGMYQQLKQLAAAPYPDVATAAKRLLAVSTQRAAFHQLASDQQVHPAFAQVLRKIAVSTPAQANPLREQQLGFLRPNKNPHYQAAQTAIQSAIRRLMRQYPGIYALEQTWLNELYNYDPQWDIERDDDVNNFDVISGLIVLAVLPICGFVAWAILF
ncbi:hypothetical protein UC8_58890 [Roseimaritima ulvae]|uniref:Uncharacterized protein n=2 Tax=Roseimaritima ulvae TaxID=980254 RepID=A0A5B9R0C9_9BACT|nr:hypothetical protein UC8_58890 [Roseimaritima ulvae]